MFVDDDHASGRLGGDRLRGRRRALGQGQGGAAAPVPGAAGGRRRRRVPAQTRRSRRRSSAGPPSCAWSRTSSTPRSTAASPGWSGSRVRRGSARPGSARSSRNYVDGLADRRALAFGALPVVRRRASPTGRSPRWSASDSGSPRTHRENEAVSRLAEGLERWIADPRRARADRRGARGADRDRRARARARRAVRGLAAVLRAALRARPGGAAVRGHAMGRRGPARLPRAAARLVGRAPDLRLHLRPTRARRAPARLAAPGSPTRPRCARAARARRR